MYEKHNTDCFDMSEVEAKNKIKRILDYKTQRSNDGKVLYGYKAEDILFYSFSKNLSKKGDGFSSVDLTYIDKNTKKPLAKAEIYEGCEVQWVRLE